ncbi:unnamed protein product [Schistosoma spindalis]|nr:unnamed protein product [Schistosoma spindale]
MIRKRYKTGLSSAWKCGPGFVVRQHSHDVVKKLGKTWLTLTGSHLREHSQEFQISRPNCPPLKFRLLHLFVNDCNSVSEHVISLPVNTLKVN